jgi:predicted lipoprotein with Yx(FWY)xxD motif
MARRRKGPGWLAALLPFAAVALIAAGCGDEDSSGGGNATGSDGASMTESEKGAQAAASMPPSGALVEVVGSDYGRVIADHKGEAFYLFDKEDTKRPECYGACASVWPPVLTKGKPKAGNRVEQGLLGTTKRSNGKLQVTYAGHPLYYYVDDSPGTILCHDVAEFGGLWLVVKPNGQAAS